MTKHAKIETGAAPSLSKSDPSSSALFVAGPNLILKAGTSFGGQTFEADTPVSLPALEAGADYAVSIVDGFPKAVLLTADPIGPHHIGGFHFAPGGNAPARAGGDEVPAINPRSLWDLKFRPSSDPRGQILVERFGLKFWADIYLLGVDHHINGTSKFGVTIVDGNEPPVNPVTDKKFKKLDYATAVAVMEHHEKGLMSYAEFCAFAFGVTEKTACGKDPKITGLDAPRTSQDGAMQATGNMWTWGHDGDPDQPRSSLFGGDCWADAGAGSRCAVLDYWPGDSYGSIGARGRSDHLQLA